jgi:sarcosine oxidase
VSLGAEVHAEEPVREWRAVGGGVEVRTDRGAYSAARLVVTAGPWATAVLRDLGVPLTVMRQVLLWFRPTDASLFRRDRFPIFLVDDASGAYYGLPMIDGRGVKLARHYGAAEVPTPDAVDRTARPADGEAVRPFVRQYLPAGDGPLGESQVCLYTLTPDRHFVIDAHPLYPQVAVACGFSGHGFKFAAAVGEVLADLAIDGTTRHDIGLFRATRFTGGTAHGR